MVAICALLAAFVTVVALGRGLDAAGIESPPVALAIVPKVLKTLSLVRSSPDGSRILLVGNSTAMSRRPRRSLHKRLDVALDARVPQREGGVRSSSTRAWVPRTTTASPTRSPRPGRAW
jgi:hypothetical protein